MPSPPDSVREGIMFLSCAIRLFVHPVRCCYYDSSWAAWTISMKLDREYSLAPTDGLVRFWRSKVKVTAGCRCGEDIDFNAGASKSIL